MISVRSIRNNIWKYKSEGEKSSNFISKLFEQRKDIFEGEESHDPYLFNDMKKAVDRVYEAIKNDEKIMLVGDYDVDGISGVALLFTAISKLGGQVSYRIPHRERDGYGLRPHQVNECKDLDVRVLITVDNGISSKEAIVIAKEVGIDLIITDHHTIPEIVPECFAILHPSQINEKYPFKKLSGAGVALKLAQGLLGDNFDNNLYQFASLGTVCDIVSLKGENRFIVKQGLEMMMKSPLPGIYEILQTSGISSDTAITSFDIGFKIGPRINAAGRMDHGIHALQVLIASSDYQKKAKLIDELNKQRQELLKKIVDEVIPKIRKMEERNVYVIKDPTWHPGIIGLIASKISEEVRKPTFVFGKFDSKPHWVGSGRSIKGVDITKLLRDRAELLEHFGGHEMACGCSIEDRNMEFFKESFADVSIPQELSQKVLNYDASIELPEINIENIEQIKDLEPFGEGNPVPNFVINNMQKFDVAKMGKRAEHLKIFSHEKPEVSFVGFGLGEYFDDIKNASQISLLGKIEKNEWDRKVIPQFRVVDVVIG